MLLRGSTHAGEATLAWARQAAAAARGEDPRRAELVELIDAADALLREEPRQVGAARPPAALRELSDAGLIDSVLGSGVKQGYRFEVLVSPDDPLRWMAVASPAAQGTGDRWFVTNHEGVVYYGTSGPFRLDPSCAIPADARPVGK